MPQGEFEDQPMLGEFVDSLLCIDPTKRLTADQALQHPWMAEIAPIRRIPRGYPSTHNSSDRGNTDVPRQKPQILSLPLPRSSSNNMDTELNSSTMSPLEPVRRRGGKTVFVGKTMAQWEDDEGPLTVSM